MIELTEGDMNTLKKLYEGHVVTLDAVFDDENDIINTWRGIMITDEKGFSKLVKDGAELILLTQGLTELGCVLEHTENMKKFELATKRALFEADPEKYGAYFDEEGNLTDEVVPLSDEAVDDVIEWGKENNYL